MLLVIGFVMIIAAGGDILIAVKLLRYHSSAREAQLSTWDKPSFACLATRIPCGEEITLDKLAVIEEAEQFLFDRGFKQFRVRFHGPIARIEIDRAQFQKLLDPAVADQVSRHFKDLGFRHVTLDLGGYQTGSTNQVLN